MVCAVRRGRLKLSILTGLAGSSLYEWLLRSVFVLLVVFPLGDVLLLGRVVAIFSLGMLGMALFGLFAYRKKKNE